jgi:hypothetical protein
MSSRVAGVAATGAVVFVLGVLPATAFGAREFGADLTGSPGTADTCTSFSYTATGATGPGCVSVIASADGDVSAAAPVSGVLVSWSAKSSTAMPGSKLRVMHDPNGTASSASLEPVTYSGTSAAADVPGDGLAHTFLTQLPITQGDLIGIETPGSFFHRPASGSSRKLRVYQGSPDGTSPAEADNINASSSALVLPPIRGSIEADADGDGFGDETQDQCSTDASTQGPCAVPDVTAPETTITKKPKAKTTSKKPTFEFVSSEAGSTFECSLDGAPFEVCTSPHKVKAKKLGKHNFQVRARDAAGNVDPTEAASAWKLKKKPKHK